MTSWNGRRGAVSITFDDGLPEHIRYAIPQLNSRNMRGTFFVVQSPELTPRKYDTCFRREAWKQAMAAGHEIAGHSVTHASPEDMSIAPARAAQEVTDCHEFLTQEIGAPVSYAYPFTYVTEGLKSAARTCFKQARGIAKRPDDAYIALGDSRIDLFDIPSIQVGGNNVRSANVWLRAAVNQRAWIVLMLHGVGPNATLYDNMSAPQFAELLSLISKHDVWVATFAEAAQRFRESL